RWDSNSGVNVRIKIDQMSVKLDIKKVKKRIVFHKKRFQDTIQSILGPFLFCRKIRKNENEAQREIKNEKPCFMDSVSVSALKSHPELER
ncbi:MAG: hypothetical protein ACLTC4_18035, partial [Hungatella hathewayi]